MRRSSIKGDAVKKIDIFTHILPREFYERMIQLDPKPKGINNG